MWKKRRTVNFQFLRCEVAAPYACDRLHFLGHLRSRASQKQANVAACCSSAFVRKFTEETGRGVSGAMPRSAQHCLLSLRPLRGASWALPVVAFVCCSQSSCGQQATSRRSFYESCFAMHIFPRKPSVLFVKTTHVHFVLQSSAVQVCTCFCPVHVLCTAVFHQACW